MKLGLASHLQTFPDNEIKKGQVAMKLKKLQAQGATVVWPKTSNDLPVLNWDQCTFRLFLTFFEVSILTSFSFSSPRGC